MILLKYGFHQLQKAAAELLLQDLGHVWRDIASSKETSYCWKVCCRGNAAGFIALQRPIVASCLKSQGEAGCKCQSDFAD